MEVKAEAFDLERQESPAAVSLVGNEAKDLASVLSDDPLRAVQGLPAAAHPDRHPNSQPRLLRDTVPVAGF